ncbi:MAG: ferrochelatase [Terriglobales bacterium]
MKPKFDAVLVVSFGGPERRADVIPFLERVLAGRNVPRERLEAVAQHYYHFGGRSPIGAATRAIRGALERELTAHGPRLPVYLGNRNWHPLLEDTLRQMAGDGVRSAAAVVTSGFGSHAGSGRYLEDIARSRAGVGASAPRVRKLRLYYDHPQFLRIWAERVRAGFSKAGAGAGLIFTAHSIPEAMPGAAAYQRQLRWAAGRIAKAAGAQRWWLGYQSRSGPPGQPWLAPSVEQRLAEARGEGCGVVVAAPLGFISDHMEVVYDLDVEAREEARRRGLRFVRVATPGNHPKFAALLRALIIGE